MSEQKPAVAVGQVWKHVRASESQAPMVIHRVIAGLAVQWSSAVGEVCSIRDLEWWRCVGIETSHGRVMVGERRQFKTRGGDPRTFTVGAIGDSGFARSCEGPGYPADLVASWPLVSSLAQAAEDADAHVVRSAADTRETRRRAIDAILAEDARKFPAFAAARKATIVAREEPSSLGTPANSVVASTIGLMLGWLREYEDRRCGMSKPSPDAWRYAASTFGWDSADIYELARGRAVPAVVAPTVDPDARARAIRAMATERTIAEAYGAPVTTEEYADEALAQISVGGFAVNRDRALQLVAMVRKAMAEAQRPTAPAHGHCWDPSYCRSGLAGCVCRCAGCYRARGIR